MPALYDEYQVEIKAGVMEVSMSFGVKPLLLCLLFAVLVPLPGGSAVQNQSSTPAIDNSQPQTAPQGQPTTPPVVADQVQKEVDRAFEHTFAIINILLVLLALVPILFGLAAWALRSTIQAQLAGQLKKEFKDEATELASQAKGTLEKKANDLLGVVMAQLKQDMELQLGRARSDFALQMSAISIEKQQEKDRLIQRIRALRIHAVPNFFEVRGSKDISPEHLKELERLTMELELLKKDYPEILFSTADYIEQGNALYLEGVYEKALDFYGRATELDPNNAESWYRKGEALRMLERREDALNSYRQAIELEPQDPLGWLGSGYVLDDLKRTSEAENLYRKALDLVDKKIVFEPNIARWWNLRGNALRDLGNQVEAINSFDRALQINPAYYEALVNRATSQRRLADFDGAISSCERAIKLDSKLPSAWYNKACYHSIQKQSDRALECLAQAIKISPTTKVWARGDDDFENIRENPKFQELME